MRFVVFTCPHCEYETEQPDAADVWHTCPARRGRQTLLKRKDPDE